MASPNHDIYTPDYMSSYPHMSMSDFVSSSSHDLGSLTGLYHTANASISSIYGTRKFKLKPENLSDLSGLTFDNFAGGGNGITYVVLWIIVSLLLLLTGFVWCLCNKCICCCRTSFKDKDDANEDKEKPVSSKKPNYITRLMQKDPKKTGIVLSALMVLWLIFLLLIIIYAFKANAATHNAIGHIHVDLSNFLNDVDKYVDICIQQLQHLLDTCFVRFGRLSIKKIVEDCDRTNFRLECEEIDERIEEPLRKGVSNFQKTLTEFSKAVKEVQKTLRSAKVEAEAKFEESIANVNKKINGFFIFFNVLYLIVFCLVLAGMIMAIVLNGKMKTWGFKATRLGIFIMFVLIIAIMCQMLFMFIVGCLTTQMFCPALKELEELHDHKGNETTRDLWEMLKASGYKPPLLGEMMIACKRDLSAFLAFHLDSALNIHNLTNIYDDFRSNLDHIQNYPNANGSAAAQKLNPVQTTQEIFYQTNNFIAFIIHTIENEVARCQPAYNAITALISVICGKIAAPLICMWFLHQFLPPLFVLIIMTALCFERTPL